MRINEAPIAAIFDNDGTLGDTHPPLFQGIDAFLRQHDRSLDMMSDPHNQGFRGYSFPGFWGEMTWQLGLEVSYEEFKQGAEQESTKLMIAQNVTAETPLVNLLEELKLFEVPLAVASSSYNARTFKILDLLGVRPYFDVVVAGDDVPIDRHKPDSFIYEEAARRLGIEAARCVVFEDAPIGIEGAKKAGMKTVGVANYYDHKGSLEAADLVITDYKEVSYDMLRELVDG